MRSVFLDTVGLLALWDVGDAWHTQAEQAFSEQVAAGTFFTTTSYILLECGNAAARRPYRSEPHLLRLELEAAGALLRPTEQDWEQAWEAYRCGGAAQAGIVDHVSFVVMRRLGVTTAFTNDHHFRAAGF
ncbi:MAG: hypothetical protein AMXMBFR13_49410 [Phycisphaerae bacterium]